MTPVHSSLLSATDDYRPVILARDRPGEVLDGDGPSALDLPANYRHRIAFLFVGRDGTRNPSRYPGFVICFIVLSSSGIRFSTRHVDLQVSELFSVSGLFWFWTSDGRLTLHPRSCLALGSIELGSEGPS